VRVWGSGESQSIYFAEQFAAEQLLKDKGAENMFRRRIAPGNVKPMISVAVIYWFIGLLISIFTPNSANSEVATVILNNLTLATKLLPAIDALSKSSEIAVVARCFFAVMWTLFPIFLIFLYINSPEVIEAESSKLLHGLWVCLLVSVLIFWFFGLHDKPYKIDEVPISRGAIFIKMMTSTRIGLSIIGTMFMSAIGFFLVISIKCAERLVLLQIYPANKH
jgi:hypothetical protein